MNPPKNSECRKARKPKARRLSFVRFTDTGERVTEPGVWIPTDPASVEAMVERAAKAIHNQRYTFPWEKCQHACNFREDALAAARAALAAVFPAMGRKAK